MTSNKKQEILNSAEKLFNRFGIKKTAVDDIAAAARVAKGTIYNYFGNKEGIISEILKKKISYFEEKVESSIQSPKDPVVKLKLTIMQRFQIIIDTPFLSDRSIHFDDIKIKNVLDEMDRFAKKIINRVIEYDLKGKIPQIEKNRVLDTLLYTMKGIEESIKNRMDDISMEAIEKDIEFLIISIFSKYNLSYQPSA